MLRTKAYKNSVFFLLLFTNCYGSSSQKVLEFSLEPSDIAVPEGNSVLLQCAGRTQPEALKEGKTAPNIRWRGPDGQDIGIVGDTFRTQLKNGSLYISSVEDNRGLTGSYQCLLSIDGVGTIVSRSAKLSVAKLPEINQLSSEIYLFPGQTAYLRCMIGTVQQFGIKYLTTWLKDDAPLHYDHTRMLLLPSGALEIDEVTPSDRGTYQCNVTAGSFSRLSSKSNLNIKSTSGAPESFAPPTFATVPSSQIVKEGDTITLDCVANGNPKPTVKWLKNGEDIDINDLDSRFQIVGTGSLQINFVEDTDAGDFQCRSSNTVDSSDATATIEVQVPPKFIQSPVDKIAFIKEELELVCSIHGKPTPTIQWLKNGDSITPNDYMQIVGGHNLKIYGLISSDAGMFQCIGTNPAGSIQGSARLQIVEPDKKKLKITKPQEKQQLPKFIQAMQPLQNQNQKDRSNTNLLSKSVFDSLLSKEPKKSNKSKDNLNNNDDEYDDYDDDSDDDDDDDDNVDEETIHPWAGEDPKKLLHTLTAGKRDEISYVSHSSLPPITRKYPTIDGIGVEMQRLPGPPRDVQAQIVKPRFVTLSWMEPLKNPDEVTSYTVYYKMNQSERERKLTTKSRDDQEVNIQSLLPGKTYQFRVVGNSNNGAGETSEILEVYTQSEENIAGPPQDTIGNSLSHNEINVIWKPPLVPNGKITNYRIYYSEDDSGPEMYKDSDTLDTTLKNLRPFTEYTISVVAFNQNGMGDPSNEIKVKTYSAIPSESPYNVTLEATSSTSITIRWEPPPDEERNGQITGYKIRYRKIKKTLQVATTSANLRHFELKNLDRMSEYQVKIAAININGTGPFTEWLYIETYENDLDESQVPGVPSFIQTHPSSDSITVHWGSPAQQEIKIRGYILGWGKGIPDEISQELDENSRYFKISGLEPNNEYVISLSARNLIGDGPPVYDYVRTREDGPIEQLPALEVPVGLRAITMSASSIVVFWTDTMLSKSQHVTDNRHYVVRYISIGANRYKYHNTTDLNCMISDLKANTQYEFEVKLVKGRRESAWSMSVMNSTMLSIPLTPPREFKIKLDDKFSGNVILQWQSPKHSNGPITGYIILYTFDETKLDRDWSVQPIIGDQHNATIRNLNPLTTYHFKIQSRTEKMLGAFSNVVTIKTGRDLEMKENLTEKGYNEMIIYIIVGVSALPIILAAVVIYILCRKKPVATPEHCKKSQYDFSYQKNNTGIIKPPDLWIHHDQMELKNMEKNHLSSTPGCSDGASSSGALTLPRSVIHDFENESQLSHVTNSLDKRTYVPGYTTTTPMGTSDRQQYPRTQYSMPRVHVSMDPALSQQNLSQSLTNSLAQTPENPYGYDSMPSNYSNVTYAPGISVDAPKRGQGHPLKSFSVPAPPPATTPIIPGQSKHVPVVTIRPQNASPYKKSVLSTPSMPTNRLQTGQTVAHSSDEIQRLQPSTSTEELNQEMANLEGLMKDLSAITANEFEC